MVLRGIKRKKKKKKKKKNKGCGEPEFLCRMIEWRTCIEENIKKKVEPGIGK